MDTQGGGCRTCHCVPSTFPSGMDTIDDRHNGTRKHLPLLVGEYHAQRSAHDTPGAWTAHGQRVWAGGGWWNLWWLVAAGRNSQPPGMDAWTGGLAGPWADEGACTEAAARMAGGQAPGPSTAGAKPTRTSVCRRRGADRQQLSVRVPPAEPSTTHSKRVGLRQ